MEYRVPRTKPVSQPIITVSVGPGLAKGYDKRLWSRFWNKLITSVKKDETSPKPRGHDFLKELGGIGDGRVK